MASFQEAIGKTLLFEGGYVNDPSDSGGETYEGVSRHNFPSWRGWQFVDLLKDDPGFPRCLANSVGLQSAVIDFYRSNFWTYDGLSDQSVADKIFDLGVNVGKVHAVKITQKAVGTNEDGLWGPNTERLVNSWSTSSGSLLSVLIAAAEEYHKEIVQANPEDAKFLDGWLRRDAS